MFVSLLAPYLFAASTSCVRLLACGLLAAAFLFTTPGARKAAKRPWHPALPALLAVVALIGAAFGMRLMGRTQTGLRELRNFYGVLRIQDLRAPDGRGACAT